jgi:molybdenum-dependent DNA-binding transcriptional regulator ModE
MVVGLSKYLVADREADDISPDSDDGLPEGPIPSEHAWKTDRLEILRQTGADLNSLVLFTKVVEAGSFSEAARRLKMPISTVSRRIAELEDQLGVRLLERSTLNLRLTELGAKVLEHAVRSSTKLSRASFQVGSRTFQKR